MKLTKGQCLLAGLLLFIPLSIYFELAGSENLAFITSLMALVPLAWIMGFATKEIALQSNPSVSGLVSATFGNLIELIIAIIALNHGLVRIVQASIVGSIIANILFLVGLSIFFGGLKFKHQHFNKEAIGVSSTMLIIVVIGLAIPSVYSFFRPDDSHLGTLSTMVAAILAVIYCANLLFSLKTHKDLFDASDEIRAARHIHTMTIRKALFILFVCVLLAAVESNILVRSVEKAALSIGITETFIGLILIAIVTNIAEKTTAVSFAMMNKLDVSLEIGLSSAIQIALFVVPILIFTSQIFHLGFMLVFSMFEVVALVFAVMIINDLAADGRCNWLEGAQLIAVYLIIAAAFFFI